MADTLPKSSNSKTSGANKTGIAIVIAIMAVAISVGWFSLFWNYTNV